MAFPHILLLHIGLFFNNTPADCFAFQICLHASRTPIHWVCQSQIPSALIRHFTPSSTPQEISKANLEWNAGAVTKITPLPSQPDPLEMAEPQQSSPVALTWKRRLLQDEGCYRELLPQLRFHYLLHYINPVLLNRSCARTWWCVCALS